MSHDDSYMPDWPEQKIKILKEILKLKWTPNTPFHDFIDSASLYNDYLNETHDLSWFVATMVTLNHLNEIKILIEDIIKLLSSPKNNSNRSNHINFFINLSRAIIRRHIKDINEFAEYYKDC